MVLSIVFTVSTALSAIRPVLIATPAPLGTPGNMTTPKSKSIPKPSTTEALTFP